MAEIMTDMRACSGCRACEQICASGAISMKRDDEGFAYPQITAGKCVGCGRCTRVCPVEQQVPRFLPQAVYAAYQREEKILADSSSGGVFTAIAEVVLEAGGVVVGCAMGPDFRARQVILRDRELLFALRGSKYVQSDTGDTYSRVRELLHHGVSVLYTGTPCQIAGLKSFLGREYETLLTASFICHGVPSPELFVQHIGWRERKDGQLIRRYRFRCKLDANRHGMYYYSYLNATGVVHGSAVLDPYYFAFLQAQTYRNCCYQCPYAEHRFVSDLTFADYWEVEKFHPELKDIFGVSALLLNTAKGLSYQTRLAEKLVLTDSRLEWVREINFNLNQATRRPAARDSIYQQIAAGGYDKWADDYCATLDWKLRYWFGKLPPGTQSGLRKLLQGGGQR